MQPRDTSPRQSPARAEPVDEVELWRSVINSWKRLQRGAEKSLMRLDLSVAELRILRVLEEQGTSPMHRFSSETLLSQPAITGIVDKLEERGLVERVRSLEDRREVLIAITSKGRQLYAKGIETHRRFVEKSLAGLDEAEVALLAELLRKLADSSDSVSKEEEIPRIR